MGVLYNMWHPIYNQIFWVFLEVFPFILDIITMLPSTHRTLEAFHLDDAVVFASNTSFAIPLGIGSLARVMGIPNATIIPQ